MSVMIPIIKVKDTHTGVEHIVGTNSHDRLVLEGNALHYSNYQSMAGTMYGDYRFVGEIADRYDLQTEVEFVTLEEFAKLYGDILKEQNENERQLQNSIKDLFEDLFAEEEAAEEIKKSDGYIPHT